jgi:hypothetical protein
MEQMAQSRNHEIITGDKAAQTFQGRPGAYGTKNEWQARPAYIPSPSFYSLAGWLLWDDN